MQRLKRDPRFKDRPEMQTITDNRVGQWINNQDFIPAPVTAQIPNQSSSSTENQHHNTGLDLTGTQGLGQHAATRDRLRSTSGTDPSQRGRISGGIRIGSQNLGNTDMGLETDLNQMLQGEGVHGNTRGRGYNGQQSWEPQLGLVLSNSALKRLKPGDDEQRLIKQEEYAGTSMVHRVGGETILALAKREQWRRVRDHLHNSHKFRLLELPGCRRTLETTVPTSTTLFDESQHCLSRRN